MPNKTKFMILPLFFGFCVFTFLTGCSNAGSSESNLRFSLSFSEERGAEALDGRMLLLIANNNDAEPRFQVSDGPDSQLVYGIDVNRLQPGEAAVINADVFGYPLESISDIPPGDYWVQGLLNRYETFNRADGLTVKLPPEMGEGQQWNRKPGNRYSQPKQVSIDPRKNTEIQLILDQEIPPIPDPEDTKYIKHVKMQSDLLTEFWGRPMYLGACVLLPEGFDEHPESRYPLVINHGHFPYTFSGFRTEPPDPDLEPDYSGRFDWEGYNKTQQEYAYKFYQWWTAPDTPRVIIIKVQHANPFYDDSYAVNSENLGPYGDAITYELIPYIEEKFRGIGEGPTADPPADGKPSVSRSSIRMNITAVMPLVPTRLISASTAWSISMKIKMPTFWRVLLRQHRDRGGGTGWEKSAALWKKPIIRNWPSRPKGGPADSGIFGRLCIPRWEKTVIPNRFGIN